MPPRSPAPITSCSKGIGSAAATGGRVRSISAPDPVVGDGVGKARSRLIEKGKFISQSENAHILLLHYLNIHPYILCVADPLLAFNVQVANTASTPIVIIDKYFCCSHFDDHEHCLHAGNYSMYRK